MAQIEVTLADDQRVALEELARIRNVPVAELVRKGIEEVLRSAHARRDPELIRRAREVAGKFSSGLGDLAERHDDYFAEACEE